MAYDTVIVEKREISHLILNRPEQRNALNGTLMREIIGGLRELDQDSGVRVIIMKGAGRGFCAGADIGEFLGKGAYEARENLRLVAEVIETMNKTGKPIVGSIHGFALAGGCGIAAACDVTIAAEDAVFGTPEITIGLWPFTVMAPIFRCVGRKRGLSMMLTGERFDGREAERIGLVTRTVPAEKLDETVMELATQLAARSAVALKMGKEAFYTMTDMDYFKSMSYLREMLTLMSLTEDGQEGPRSFIEKREPKWRGR